jgi:hypothetical protein
LEIVVEGALGLETEPGQNRMISLDRFDGSDVAVDDQAEELDERQLVLGIIDFTSEQGNSGTIFLAVSQKLEGVSRRA